MIFEWNVGPGREGAPHEGGWVDCGAQTKGGAPLSGEWGLVLEGHPNLSH